MQGGRRRGDSFFGFGDLFTDFGGMPSLFGGRDPFDDPFTRPFGALFQSSLSGFAESSFMGINPFGSSLFGSSASPFMDADEPRPSLLNNSRGPIIEELNSDDEKEEPGAGQNPRKNDRSGRQPFVEHPDDESEGEEQTQYENQFSIMNNARSFPQARGYAFESSTVSYGGFNGAYYTSSTTRRTGSDGLRFEEHKEADSVSGQAAHRVSRGIHNKGHTLTRNLKSDGQVDTMQVVHNINEDELAGFEEAWKVKARKHLPGLTDGNTLEGSGDPSRWRRAQALPSTEQKHVGNTRHELRNHASSSGVRKRPDTGGLSQPSKVRRC